MTRANREVESEAASRQESGLAEIRNDRRRSVYRWAAVRAHVPGPKVVPAWAIVGHLMISSIRKRRISKIYMRTPSRKLNSRLTFRPAEIGSMEYDRAANPPRRPRYSDEQVGIIAWCGCNVQLAHREAFDISDRRQLKQLSLQTSQGCGRKQCSPWRNKCAFNGWAHGAQRDAATRPFIPLETRSPCRTEESLHPRGRPLFPRPRSWGSWP